jgi:hypothetical protein
VAAAAALALGTQLVSALEDSAAALMESLAATPTALLRETLAPQILVVVVAVLLPAATKAAPAAPV